MWALSPPFPSNIPSSPRITARPDFKTYLVLTFSKKANVSLELEYVNGPLPMVQLSGAATLGGGRGRAWSWTWRVIVASTVWFAVSWCTR